MKKTIFLLVTCVCLMIGLSVTVCAATVDSGACGDNAIWTLDDEGTLTISGTGEMDGYTYAYDPPGWTDYEKEIVSIKVEEGITSIGYDIFRCSNAVNISFPETLTSIGRNTINNTAYYNDETNWENGILYVGNYLITSKSEISGDVIIKDGTKIIADHAFNERTNITSVTIPDSATSIGYLSFESCTSLSKVTVGKGITSIEDSSFRNCTNLKTVYWNAVNSDYDEWNKPFDNSGTNVENRSVVFGEGVKTIPNGLFQNYSVNVRLKKRGYSSFKDGDYSALCNTTMSDVWKTWFNGLIIPDLSNIGQGGSEETVSIDANAACWVCLYEAKHYVSGDTIRNTFTGVVEVEIEASKALKCDTYIMEFGGEDGLLYSNIVKQNASNPLLTYCGNTSYVGGGLSGSGNGAILYTSVNADEIITEGLKFVLGGDRVTNFNEVNNGSVNISMSEIANARNSCNYGTIFCVDIQCSDETVTDVVTARIRCNMATNPSAMCDIVNNSGGARGYMNVAAKHEIYDKNGNFLNQTVKGLPIYITQDGTSNELEISDNIDLNYNNRFYFVLGGISQTPFEFIIRKKELN